MAEFISRRVCLGLLVLMAAEDLKMRRVHMLFLILENAGAILYQIFWGTENIAVIAGGGITGCVFILFSKITGEKLGYGDSIGILGLGIYLGFWKMAEVLCVSFFLLLVGAILILIWKKMKRTCTLPFFPFMAASYCLWLFLT